MDEIELSTVWEDIGCVPGIDLKRFGLVREDIGLDAKKMDI